MGTIRHQHYAHSANWNPWEGCRRFSEACKHCFIFPSLYGRDTSVVRRCTSTWGDPLKWQKEAAEAGGRKTVGVCFCSDFLIEQADAWRPEAWDIIKKALNITWVILSKRTHRLADCLPPDWGNGYANVALGTSVELKSHLDRIDRLRAVPAMLRFIDLCPCLEDPTPELGDHLDGIGWVSISGECDTPNFRLFDLQWARNVRDMCALRRIPFKFGHQAGRERRPTGLLDGRVYRDIPEFLKETGKCARYQLTAPVGAEEGENHD
jgi:protein gp37